MSHLTVTGAGRGITAVSNTFIDHYMNAAGATNLKAYLLLLRMVGENQDGITVAGMADRLDCSESDVIRALRYWEKKGLLALTFNQKEELTGLGLIDPDQALKAYEDGRKTRKTGHGKAVLPTPDPEAVNSPSILPERKVDMNILAEDEVYRQLMYVTESYIGHPLSPTDCETLGWLYSKLHMSGELLEYLVEYCANNGRKSLRYIEAVALDWHEKKISTVEQAMIYTPLNARNIYAIMKALGLGNRQPAASERSVIDGWFTRYGFDLDLILEACNRTIITIHEPSLKYVESILSRWKKAGISSIDQVRQLDAQFQQEKTATGNKETDQKGSRPPAGSRNQSSQGPGTKSGGRGQGANKPGARFHDFEQRNYDYDELMKKLNQG